MMGAIGLERNTLEQSASLAASQPTAATKWTAGLKWQQDVWAANETVEFPIAVAGVLPRLHVVAATGLALMRPFFRFEAAGSGSGGVMPARRRIQS